MATGLKRDVTRALNAVLGATNTNDETERARFLSQAAQILREIDARTGRRDPSARKKKPAKKAAKRAAKKAAKRSTKTSSKTARRR
jgi:ribosomal protein S21